MEVEMQKLQELINKFNNALLKEEPTEDERFFVTNIELELAKSILQDLTSNSARKLGKILLSMTEE